MRASFTYFIYTYISYSCGKYRLNLESVLLGRGLFHNRKKASDNASSASVLFPKILVEITCNLRRICRKVAVRIFPLFAEESDADSITFFLDIGML